MDRVTRWTLNIAGGAAFSHAIGFGTDGAGNLYVSDSFGNVLRLTGVSGFTPYGAVPLPAGGGLLLGAMGVLAFLRRSRRVAGGAQVMTPVRVAG